MVTSTDQTYTISSSYTIFGPTANTVSAYHQNTYFSLGTIDRIVINCRTITCHASYGLCTTSIVIVKVPVHSMCCIITSCTVLS